MRGKMMSCNSTCCTVICRGPLLGENMHAFFVENAGVIGQNRPVTSQSQKPSCRVVIWNREGRGVPSYHDGTWARKKEARWRQLHSFLYLRLVQYICLRSLLPYFCVAVNRWGGDAIREFGPDLLYNCLPRGKVFVPSPAPKPSKPLTTRMWCPTLKNVGALDRAADISFEYRQNSPVKMICRKGT